eukprot:m51a1_g7915 hypothetical protein (336) ;mRNA; r:208521-210261
MSLGSDLSSGAIDPMAPLITREFLARYFHMPISQAAKELGVCTTMLKKMCRKNGVPRWPFRKIHSLDRMISNMEQTLRSSQDDPAVVRELSILRARRTQIISNPEAVASKKGAADSDSDSDSPAPRTRKSRSRSPETSDSDSEGQQPARKCTRTRAAGNVPETPLVLPTAVAVVVEPPKNLLPSPSVSASAPVSTPTIGATQMPSAFQAMPQYRQQHAPQASLAPQGADLPRISPSSSFSENERFLPPPPSLLRMMPAGMLGTPTVGAFQGVRTSPSPLGPSPPPQMQAMISTLSPIAPLSFPQAQMPQIGLPPLVMDSAMGPRAPFAPSMRFPL